MTSTTDIDAPKDGTKEAALVASLTGKGESLVQLSTQLGWQAHTIRAAFTRLRKRGYVIERVAPTARTAARFRIKQ